jgi:hypothetical protein
LTTDKVTLSSHQKLLNQNSANFSRGIKTNNKNVTVSPPVTYTNNRINTNGYKHQILNKATAGGRVCPGNGQSVSESGKNYYQLERPLFQQKKNGSGITSEIEQMQNGFDIGVQSGMNKCQYLMNTNHQVNNNIESEKLLGTGSIGSQIEDMNRCQYMSTETRVETEGSDAFENFMQGQVLKTEQSLVHEAQNSDRKMQTLKIQGHHNRTNSSSNSLALDACLISSPRLHQPGPISQTQEPETQYPKPQEQERGTNGQPQQLSKTANATNHKIYHEDYSLEIKVLSTWGKGAVAGLTEIQLFDDEAQSISIKPSHIHLVRCGTSAPKRVGNLVNGIFHTNNELDMWTFLLPTAPEAAEISINFKSANGLGAVRIWNYNVSEKDGNSKGIKDINLFLNKNLFFNGTIFPGKGKIEDYCSTVFLTRNNKVLSLNKGNYNFFVDQNLTDKIRDIRDTKINQAFNKTTSNPGKPNTPSDAGAQDCKEKPGTKVAGQIHRNKQRTIPQKKLGSGSGVMDFGITASSLKKKVTVVKKPRTDGSGGIVSPKNQPKDHETGSTIERVKNFGSGLTRMLSGNSMESNRFLNKNYTSLTPKKKTFGDDERSLPKNSRESLNLKMGKRHPKVALPWSMSIVDKDSTIGGHEKKNSGIEMSKPPSSNLQTPKKTIEIPGAGFGGSNSGGYLANRHFPPQRTVVNPNEFTTGGTGGPNSQTPNNPETQVVPSNLNPNHLIFQSKKGSSGQGQNSPTLAPEAQRHHNQGSYNQRESSAETVGSITNSIKVPSFMENASKKGLSTENQINAYNQNLKSYQNKFSQNFGSHKSITARNVYNQKFVSQHMAKILCPEFKQILDANQDFVIPTLPSGNLLTIELFSNWGDVNHIGINGIEFFDEFGKVYKFENPEDNIWMKSNGKRKKPSIYNDPSFLSRIISGKFLTRDQNDIWITNREKSSS